MESRMISGPKFYAIQLAMQLEPCDVETLLSDADQIVDWLTGADDDDDNEGVEVVFSPDVSGTVN